MGIGMGGMGQKGKSGLGHVLTKRLVRSGQIDVNGLGGIVGWDWEREWRVGEEMDNCGLWGIPGKRVGKGFDWVGGKWVAFDQVCEFL
jgi:hypothetical protein